MPSPKHRAAVALGRQGGRGWAKRLADMPPEARADEMRRRVARRWAPPEGRALETRAVLGAAYVTLENGCLTHTAVLDEQGREPAFVLCRGVKPEHLADPGATDPQARPTCPTCAERLARLAADRLAS